MSPASLAEIKAALKKEDTASLVELLLRLGRFKKDNKELLSYLLFEADDPDGFLQSVKDEIDEGFGEMNKSNVYFAKKTIRKLLRNTNKYIRYTGSKEMEIELLLHFCKAMKNSGIKLEKSMALLNLYNGQLKKIRVAIATLHEDLQYDFAKQADLLSTT